MSALSKVSFLISGFSLIVMAGARFVLGAWHPLLYGFLVLFLLGLIVSVALDYKLYLEFLSIKTAKRGLNLGWSLLLLIVFLTGLAYLGSRFNKSFDLTEEGINSLAEQTTDVLKSLDSELIFLIFSKGDKVSEQVSMLKQELKNDLSLYKQASPKVKVVFVDSYKNHAKSEEYLSDLPDKNQQELFVFVNYKDRKIRVEIPFTEEALTSAIIKAKKREFKEILFVTGHGEKDLNNTEASGLKIFNQSLTDSGFILKEWNFVQQGLPQSQSALIMIVGPTQPFLPAEKTWLTDYLSKGGNLFVSLDPKERHELQDWLKNYGVIFNNDFIISQLGILYGGPTKALGVSFDTNNPITKRLPAKQAVFFEKTSSIDISPSALEKFKISQMVRSHNNSFTVPELKEKIKMKDTKSLTMAVTVQTKQNNNSNEKDKDSEKSSNKTGFHLAVFGDSDFLTNSSIYEGANRDLALNTVSALAGEEELISIRPKQPKGTKISLNRPQRTTLVLLYIILPCVFLFTGLWIWYRRRES